MAAPAIAATTGTTIGSRCRRTASSSNSIVTTIAPSRSARSRVR